MIKEELRKLRKLNATPEMMRKAAEDKPYQGKYGWQSYDYTIPAFLRARHLKGYLKIAVFYTGWMKKGITTPIYEIYINISGDGDYITRELDENGIEIRWLTAKLENLKIPGSTYYKIYYNGQSRPWMDGHQAANIKKTLHTEKSGCEAIREYQNSILREKIIEREKREQAPWDADMALVPAEPKSFDRWLIHEGVNENYIFYHYGRNITEGWCSYCEHSVKLKEKPKHNGKSICPCCKKPVRYKSDGKISTLGTEHHAAFLIQKIPGGIVIRLYDIRRLYNNTTYDKPKLYKYELERTLVRNGIFKFYDYEVYKNKFIRWCPASRPYHDSGKLYKRNLAGLEKKELKYSGLPEIARHLDDIDVINWLLKEKNNVILEQCVKVGAYSLANDIAIGHEWSDIDNKRTELTKALNIDKSRLKRLIACDGGNMYLAWLQYEKKQDTIYPDEIIRTLSTRLIEPNIWFNVTGRMPLVKAYNYLVKQAMPGESINQTLGRYQDYLNMAEKAKYNLDEEQIYKPKSLTAAHSEVIDVLQQDSWKKQAKTTRKKYPKVDTRCKELKKYEYGNDKYMIVAPSGIEDIIKEGTLLHHCIHTCDFYYERIQTKESFLMFLRKTSDPKKSWYTLEIEPNGNIRQKRTTGDRQEKDLLAAVPFLKEWQKWLQKKLTADDKKLAAESEKKRKENYKKIREEKKTVWHGKMAGRLLADVLEEDFLGLEELSYGDDNGVDDVPELQKRVG